MGVSDIQEGTNNNQHMQRFFNHWDLALESKCDGRQDPTI
jgi:hypothetical protein